MGLFHLDHFPINALTTTVFSFMVKKGKNNSGNVTPLFPSMLAQLIEDEGTVLERLSETQPNLSLLTQVKTSLSHSLTHSSDLLLLTQFLIPFQKALVGIMKGRKPAKSEPTVHKDPAFDDLNDAMDYMETEDAHEEGIVKDSKETRVSTAEPNEGTAKPKDGNSDESAAPTTVFRDYETIAQFLVIMSQNKTKQKGFEIKDTDRPRTKTERINESDVNQKGVKKLKEETEYEKKKLAEEEATKAAFTNEYDFIQARLNADKILAQKLQEEEREKFTIEQRAKFLYDTIAAQRIFLAQQRSEAIRNKLPTRNQLRNQMMTYLKYVGGYRHAQLNKKKFEEIQVMYEKVKRANENFIPIGSAKDEKLIEKMNEKAVGMDKKREENQLRTFLKIVTKKEEKIDYEVLGTRYPIINWESKFYDYGHFGRELIYYKVFRADGSLRWIKNFSEMIKLFDRMDLVEIHSLVMKRVHVLRLEDGTVINMLAERRYPLTKNTLKRMMDLRLIAISDDGTVFDLLRFIEQQIEEFGGQDVNEEDL
ncbi:hypothetical protein Tco_0108916 [Tanacetum coccineum]